MARPTPRASIRATGKRYGPRFPAITVSDIVATQRQLLDHLGIDKMVAIVGPSYGGFQAFQWAVNYPDAMRGIAAVVTAPALPPERSDANVANLMGVLSKNPNWNGGDYYDHGGVLESLIQIRSATLKTYGIETRLRDTMSDPGADRSGDPRGGGAMGARLRRQLAADPGPRAARLRRHGRASARSRPRCSTCCRAPTSCFRPRSRHGVMAALKAAGVDADYFLLDSDTATPPRAATGRNGRRGCGQFMESLGAKSSLRAKRSDPRSPTCCAGSLRRGACHRLRFAPDRWRLAMTELTPPPSSRI